MTKSTTIRYREWVDSSNPGEILIYHNSANRRNDKIMRYIYSLAEEGKVFLCQKRAGKHSFSYMAIRISPETGERLKPKRNKRTVEDAKRSGLVA